MTTRQIALTGMAVLLLLLGAACAGMPPAPQSAREAVGQAQILLDEVVQGATNLQAQGVTTPAQETRLADLFDRAARDLRMALILLDGGDEAGSLEATSLAKQSILAARNLLAEEKP